MPLFTCCSFLKINHSGNSQLLIITNCWYSQCCNKQTDLHKSIYRALYTAALCSTTRLMVMLQHMAIHRPFFDSVVLYWSEKVCIISLNNRNNIWTIPQKIKLSMLAFVFSSWIPPQNFVPNVEVFSLSSLIKHLLQLLFQHLGSVINLFSCLLKVNCLINPSLNVITPAS